MKKSKIKIADLKVKSFITSQNDVKVDAVKGGWHGNNCGGITDGNVICPETICPDPQGICQEGFTIGCDF